MTEQVEPATSDFTSDLTGYSHCIRRKEQWLLDLATKMQTEEGRNWSYADFKNKIEYSYFKNLICSLKKQGKVVTDIRSFRCAFYRVVGVPLPCERKLVTLDSMDTQKRLAVDALFNITGAKEPAIHDVHLLGHADGIHEACLAMGHQPDSKGTITLFKWKIDAYLSITVSVHTTDNFSVVFACSSKPIVCNTRDVTDFYTLLGKVHERLYRMTGVNIPLPSDWLVRSLHFNQDMYTGFDLPKGLNICTSDIHGNLLRLYTKDLPGEAQTMVRCEVVQDSKDSKPLYQKMPELLLITSPQKGDTKSSHLVATSELLNEGDTEL